MPTYFFRSDKQQQNSSEDDAREDFAGYRGRETRRFSQHHELLGQRPKTVKYGVLRVLRILIVYGIPIYTPWYCAYSIIKDV